MELNYEFIGQRLAETRKKANLTQADAAELINVTKGYISNIEKGKKPSLEYLIAIAQATNTSLDSILMGIQDETTDTSVKEILDLFLLVPKDARPFIFSTIKTIIETGLNQSNNAKNMSSTSMTGAEKEKTKTTDIA